MIRGIGFIILTTAISLPTRGFTNENWARRIPAVARTGADASGWNMRFSAAQVAELRRMGCTFDEADRIEANRMAARGFTAVDFVAAYRDRQYIGPERKADLESIAALNRVGLSPDLYFERYSGRLTLTDYYNRKVNRVGGILLGVGLPITILGGLCLGLTAYDYARTGNFGAVVAMGLLGIGSTAGFVMTIVGIAGMASRAPDQTLELGHVSKLSRYRIDDPDDLANERIRTQRLRESKQRQRQQGTSFNFSMSPVLGKKRGGLGMNLDF